MAVLYSDPIRHLMDIESIYERGFQARCEGRYADAKADLQQVLKVNPNHVPAMHQLALVWGFDGDFDKSLQGLKYLNEKNPDNLDVKYDYAMTVMMLGEYEDGCRMLKEILAVDPTHKKALDQSAYC